MSEGIFLLSFGVASLALLALALLSGSETAAYAANRVRLRAWVARGDRRTRIVARLLADVPALVATLVAGRTLAQAVVSFAVTLALETSSWAPLAEVLSVLLVAPVVILLGELAPKEAFRRHADHLLLAVAPLLAIVEALLAPVARLLLFVPRALRASGVVAAPDERAVTLEELRLLVRASDSVLGPTGARLASNALALRDRAVREVATPLAGASVARATTAEEALARLAGTDRPELLVLDGDAPVGVVDLADLVAAPPREETWRLARPVPRLHRDESLLDALERLRRARASVGVVAAGSRAIGLVGLEELARALTDPPEGGST